MIKTTRIATDHEKSLVLNYITEQAKPQESSFWFWTTSSPQSGQDQRWESASFIVLEVQDLEGKIIVVNHVDHSSAQVLDITTAHYMLYQDGSVTDLSQPGFLYAS